MSGSSFSDAIRLEDQELPNEEFEIVSDTVSSLLTKIDKSIARLDDEQDGASADADIDYQKSLKLINTLLLNFKQLNTAKNELVAFDDDDLTHTEVFAKEKLIVEINRSLKEFNRLQSAFTEIEKKATEEKQAKLNRNALIDMEESSGHEMGAHARQQQQQQQFQIEYDPINAEEMEYQQNLINERNVEIENISSSILEINEIYQDLNTMVQEQGLTIDSIENNMYSVVTDTKFARNELTKANNYQKRRNGRCLWLLVILSVLFLLILVAIVA